MLNMVHLAEGLHGSGYLSTVHFLEECVDKAIGAGAIVGGQSEGVELRLTAVYLRTEGQAPRHAQHVDSISIEQNPICALWVVGKKL